MKTFFTSQSGSWVMLAVALLAWVGVALFVFAIQAKAQAVEEGAASAQAASHRTEDSIRIHQTVKDVEPAIEQLQAMVSPDVLTIANTITAAGTEAGASVAVTDASAEPASQGQAAATSPIINFTVQGDGTFSSLSRAALLIGTLPNPSSVTSIELTHVGTGTKSWHLTLRLRVLTSAPTSS